MKPVIDPANWDAKGLTTGDDWIYHLSSGEIDELRAALAAVESRGIEIHAIEQKDLSFPTLGPALHSLHDELADGRGFILIRGIPISEFTKRQAGTLLWAIGTYFGTAISQNAHGHLLGHVKDLGKDIDGANVRGYETSADLRFHSDLCDYVGLLCLQPAKSGGVSRIVSSVTIYNEMLKRKPHLAETLVGDFYWSRHGEIPPGGSPWFRAPIFVFEQGYFSARGVSHYLQQAQGMPGVPDFTPQQTEAMDYFGELANELALEMDFQPGDIQVLNNHVIVHARTTYEDYPEPERKRHLFRLWLKESGAAARPVPREYHELIRGAGIVVEGMKFSTPLDAHEAA